MYRFWDLLQKDMRRKIIKLSNGTKTCRCLMVPKTMIKLVLVNKVLRCRSALLVLKNTEALIPAVNKQILNHGEGMLGWDVSFTGVAFLPFPNHVKWLPAGKNFVPNNY